MNVADRIHHNLTQALAPLALEIVDDSASHAGHAGSRPGGETHFNVTVVSAAFENLGRIERHRLVHEALAAELADRVHALSLKLLAPSEWQG